MSKELVISAAAHETRVAILEDGQLCEIYVEREKEFALVGSIYKGRVTRVLPGMQSAFVDIGLDSDAFLYVSDFLEDLEEYDSVVSTVESKVQRMERDGGQVFPPPVALPATLPEAPEASPVSWPEPEATASAPAEEAPPHQPGQAAPAPEPAAAPPAPRTEDLLPGETRLPPGQRPPVSESRPGGDLRGGRREGFGGGSGGRGRFGRDRGGRGGRDRFSRGRGRDDRPRDDRGPREDRGPRDDRGRDDRGNRGDRPPRFGRDRDFPASKYSAHRPYEPPSSETAESASPAGLEPIILPGESLSRYKNRPAAAPAAADRHAENNLQMNREPAAAFDELHAEARLAEPIESPSRPAPFSAPAEEPAGYALESRPAAVDQPAHAYVPPAPAVASAAALEAPPPAVQEQPAAPVRFREEEEEEHEPAANGSSDLTEEERMALAEQLAEVEHEEAQERAAGIEGDPEDASDEEEADEAVALNEAESTDEPEHMAAQYTDHGPDETDIEIRQGILDAAADAAHHDAESQPQQARVDHNPRARFQRPVRRGGPGRRPDRGGRGGPRGRHQHGRPMPPRRTQQIAEMLKAGQEIIVQIAKEPLGKKGARITSHVALPGRFLVYMPTVNHVGVSRKINSAEKRSRLRHLVGEAKAIYPGGFIVRTAAEAATDEEIRADIAFLGNTWKETLSRGEQRKAPTLLHRDLNLVERILRDHVSNDYTAIWIDNEEEYAKVVEFVGRFQPALASRVKLYSKDTPIFEELGIQQEIDKSLRPKVWLKSGGYIVINHTEALVAIDVNTGKFVGKGSTRLEDTIVRTNVEAVREVVRQIRLRDLGGIIVVDFIDMEERRNREKVMHALEDALRSDRAPSKVLPFNEFGLVAITRKRTKQALERVLCQPCPYCTGSGMVKSVPTICYEIQAEARKMALEMDGASVTLRVHPEIAKALKTRESALIEELEGWTHKTVIIQSDPTLHWEQYDIH
jgi:ribonuclease G